MSAATPATTRQMNADVDAQFVALVAPLGTAVARDLTFTYAQRVGMNVDERNALVARAVLAAAARAVVTA